jgi:hypothetical protein
VDDFEKFKWDHLPPKKAFYSNLYEQHISDEDYERAHKIWRETGCRTFKDFHEFYVKLDTLLFCDIFENFRDTAFSYFGIGMARFLTLPSHMWDAALKYTKSKWNRVAQQK